MSGARSADPWKNWTKKRKIGRLKVSRSIPAETVWNLTDAWLFAAQTLGLNCNLFITVRPKNIDDLTPPERIKLWEDIRNKIAQFGRDHEYEPVLIWSRESDPGTGKNEHLHVLTHIPRELRAAFERNAAGWFDNAVEIDTRKADYRIRWTRRGKQRSAIGYITKNSPQAAYGRPREYRKGGPILGKRTGCSRNIDAPLVPATKPKKTPDAPSTETSGSGWEPLTSAAPRCAFHKRSRLKNPPEAANP